MKLTRVLMLAAIAGGIGFAAWRWTDVTLPLLVGWATYPLSTLPRMQSNLPLLAVGLLAFACALMGMHWAGRRLTRPRLEADVSAPRSHWTWRSTLGAGGAVTLLFLAGVAVVGATHQAVWLASARGKWHVTTSGFDHASARWDSEAYSRQRRAQTKSIENLKRIGLALEQYHLAHSHWPSGTFDDRSPWESSWQRSWMRILVPAPETNHEPPTRFLHPERVNRTAASYWNPAVTETLVYHALSGGDPCFHYAGNRWVFPIATGLSREGYSDRLNGTLLVGEVTEDLRTWGNPAHLRDPLEGINTVPWGFGGPAWQQGAQFVLGDGSVRLISREIDPQVLRKISVP